MRILSLIELGQAIGGLPAFDNIFGFMQIVVGGDVQNLSFDGTTTAPQPNFFRGDSEPLTFTPVR